MKPIMMQQEPNTMVPFFQAIKTTTIRHLFDNYIHANRLNKNYSNGLHLIYFSPLHAMRERKREREREKAR